MWSNNNNNNIILYYPFSCQPKYFFQQLQLAQPSIWPYCCLALPISLFGAAARLLTSQDQVLFRKSIPNQSNFATLITTTITVITRTRMLHTLTTRLEMQTCARGRCSQQFPLLTPISQCYHEHHTLLVVVVQVKCANVFCNFFGSKN